MDLRGYGGQQVACEFTMEEAAADVIALADELGWDRFSVIGHSMGGKVAHRVAAQAPDRVDKKPSASTRCLPTAMPMDAQGWELFSGAANAANRAAIIDFTTGNKLTTTFIAQVVQRSLENSTVEAVAVNLQAWAKLDFSGQVQPDTSTRVKLIVGVNDPALSADVMEQTWLVFFPEGEITILPDAGHYPMFESPCVACGDLSIEEIPGAIDDAAGPARPDTEVVFDPATYTSGVPFDALARLRRDTPAAGCRRSRPGLAEGPGFWLVLKHGADVESVLRRPGPFARARRDPDPGPGPAARPSATSVG